MAIKTLLSRLLKCQIFIWLIGLFRVSPKEGSVTKPVTKADLRVIAVGYFEEHPDAKDHVTKACYAYHDDIDNPYKHNFNGAYREAECLVCGRTRELVRWDDLQAHCISKLHYFGGSMPWARCTMCDRTREELGETDGNNLMVGYGSTNCPQHRQLGIKETLEAEEIKFLALLDKAKTVVPKWIAKLGMSGETLAILHHTHGYDPEVVSGVVDVPSKLIADYNAKMEEERELSRKAIVRKVVTVAA